MGPSAEDQNTNRRSSAEQKSRRSSAEQSEDILKIFKQLDLNDDGLISPIELRHKLREIDPEGFRDPKKARQLLKDIDTNQNGNIELEELTAWLKMSGDDWGELRLKLLALVGIGPLNSWSSERSEDDGSNRERKSKVHLINYKNGNVTDVYQLSKNVLGEGSFGSVTEAVHKITDAHRAIKALPKSSVDEAELQAEINIMKVLDHPNILKLYEIFEDHKYTYLVMELCSGGPLFDHIVEEQFFSEKKAATVMQQIAKGVHYLHVNSICHRDLKPENFLLQRKVAIEECVIKIIDFGTSCKFESNQVMTTGIGTPYYIAPEVFQGKYNHLCDLWSCGVIMYILLAGYPPFGGENMEEITACVLKGEFDIDSDSWLQVSQDAKDLVVRLLQYNPRERFNAQQTVIHTWIKDRAPKAKDVPLRAAQLNNIKSFCGQNKLKKAALEVIARGLQEDQIQQLKDTFVSLDSDGNGRVTLEELKRGIDKLDMPMVAGNLLEVIEGIDVDGSGTIEYTEFLAATLDKKLYQQERACWHAFHVFDKDGDGTISRKELGQVFQNGDLEGMASAEAIEQFLQDSDGDGDGRIDFNEFMTMVRTCGASK